MKYRLNGKEITRDEFLQKFSGGMVKWIDRSVEEAIDDGEPLPVFRTGYGPLVVIQ